MENYHVLKLVGEGSFGQVYKARRKFDNAIVAYKETRKKGRTEKELLSFRRECDIQKGMRHPNIIQMFDTFETESKIVVVTEYCENELAALLRQFGKISEVRAAVVACDLVSALHYLHTKRIVHRDMKPQNVLMDQSGVAKLCDFGFARLMSQTTYVLMSVKGTPLYMAPELIDEQPYDHTVDLWSLGCIVFELVTGATPFQTTNLRELVQLVRSGSINWPENISMECRSFLEGLLQKDRNDRLNWPDLLEHPFVKGRILIVDNEDKEDPRSLTSPLSASEARAKQHQIQSLASRFTSQSKKLFEKQLKKLKKSTASETNASIDVLLNNLSLRASLRSDLQAADHVMNCQTDCSVIEEENYGDPQQPSMPEHRGSLQQQAACCLPLALQQEATAAAAAAAAAVYQQWESGCLQSAYNNNINNGLSASLEEFKYLSASRVSSEHDKELKNMMERRARLGEWRPRDDAQPIENEEWTASLQSSMQEAMDGDISMLLQKNCLTLFTSPLKNPGSSSRSIELTAYLLSLPFVIDSVTPDDLDQVQEVYLNVKVVPDLVYAVKLLTALDKCGTETEASSVASRWKADHGFSKDVLQALHSVVLVLCRLVHSKKEFLVQFCDAVYVVPEGTRIFQRLLGLEKSKPRIVSDLLAVLSEILRSQTGNTELVEQILMKNKSSDELIDLFAKLLSHKQSKLRSRICVFLHLLGKFSQKTLQRVWGKALRDLLEGLDESKENSLQSDANEAIAFLSKLPFYQQDKDAWNIIES